MRRDPNVTGLIRAGDQKVPTQADSLRLMNRIDAAKNDKKRKL